MSQDATEDQDRPLTRDEVVDLLTEVGADLDAQGLRGELFVVGGAAMALAYNARRTTRDVDAVFEPKSAVYAAVTRVGGRHNLSPTWVNDAVKGLLPGEDPQARVALETAGLSVSVPSPRYLLALKVAAARINRDGEDIKLLAKVCGVDDADQVLDIAEEVMAGRRPLNVNSQYVVEGLFAPAPGAMSTRGGNRLPSPASRRPRGRAADGQQCLATTTAGTRCRNSRSTCPHHR